MKVKHIFIAATALFALSSCSMRDELARMHNEIDSFAETKIQPIEKQLELVKESLSTLETTGAEIDATLSSLKKTREEMTAQLAQIDKDIESLVQSTSDGKAEIEKALGELREDILAKIKVIEASIEELEKKDAELDKRIDELKTAVEKGISDVFEEFKKTADVIAGIQVSISTVTEAAKNLSETLSSRIEAMNETLSAELAAAVKSITEAYTALIEKTKTEILLAGDEKITAAVAASKSRILQWVNEELLSQYYTAAEVDEALKILEKSDASLKADLSELRRNLDAAVSDLTEAIEKAIKEAKIDEKIENAINKVKGDISSLKESVSTMTFNLSSLETRVASLEKQHESMASEITKLEGFDGTLQDLIKALETAMEQLGKDVDNAEKSNTVLFDTLGAHRNAINTIKKTMELINIEIAALGDAQTRIGTRADSLSTAADNLSKYLNDTIVSTKEWAKESFATLEQYKATTELISKIQASVTSIETQIGSLQSEFSKKISDKETELLKAVSDAQTRIMAAFTTELKSKLSDLRNSLIGENGWVVREALAPYMTASGFDAKLSALEQAYKEADALHAKDIEKLQKDLKSYDEGLKSKCEQCIKDALKDGGAISAAIAAKVKTYSDSYNEKFTEIESTITSLTDRVSSLETRVSSAEDQIKTILENIESLKGVDKTLQDYINAAKGIMAALGDTTGYVSNIMFDLDSLARKDAALEKMISDLTAYATSAEYKATVEEWLKTSLANYYKASEVDDLLLKITTALEKINDQTAGIPNLTSRIAALEELTKDGGELMLAIAAVKTDFENTLSTVYAETDTTSIKSRFADYYDKTQVYDQTEITNLLSTYYSKTAFEAYVAQEIAKLGDVVTIKDIEDKIKEAKEQYDKDYTQYISDAITKEDGIITSAIQTAINNVKGTYTGTIKDLADMIADIPDQLTALENVVQSILYIPEYEDNTTAVYYNDNDKSYKVDLKYRIYKNGTFDATKYTYVLNFLGTGDPITPTVTFDDKTSTLTASFTSGLPDAFFTAGARVALSLTVSDSYTNVSTKFAHLFVPQIILEKKNIEFKYKDSKSIKATQKLYLTAPGAWEVTSCPAWISISDDQGQAISGGNGSQYIFVDVARNDGADRNGNVVFTEKLNNSSKTLAVSQLSRPDQTFTSIVSDPLIIPAAGGEAVVTVTTSDGENDWKWSIDEKSSKAFSVDDSEKDSKGILKVTAKKSNTVERYIYINFVPAVGTTQATQFTLAQEKAKAGSSVPEGGQGFDSGSGNKPTTTITIFNNIEGYPYLYYKPTVMIGDQTADEYGKDHNIQSLISSLGINNGKSKVSITYIGNDKKSHDFPDEMIGLDFTDYPNGVETTISVNDNALIQFARVLERINIEKVPEASYRIDLYPHNDKGEIYEGGPFSLIISAGKVLWSADLTEE